MVKMYWLFSTWGELDLSWWFVSVDMRADLFGSGNGWWLRGDKGSV